MMKNLRTTVLLGLLALALGAVDARAQARIGTIDLGKVFDNYWKTKQAQGILNERKADMEKEYKNMMEDRKRAKEDYDKLVADASDPAVSTEEKERRKRAAEEKLKYLRDQEETIVQYERQSRVTLDEQSRRMRENILGEIRTIVNAKAKAAGYNLVLDTVSESLARTPIVLYSTGENDLTTEVLKELNATAPLNTPTSGDSTGTAPAPDQKKKK
jgi:outer membrane protein